MATPFRIPHRFNGPPGVANGGLAAGFIARAVGERVTVRLHKPIPLEADLTITEADGRWLVHQGELLIATAMPADAIGLTPPHVPTHDEAVAARARFPGLENPRFSGCFVCGAGRSDGLGVHSGVLVQPGMVAAPWTPAPEFVDAQGTVRPEILWAALDCPGFYATFQDGRYALLGELSVQSDGPVAADACDVVVGWTIDQQGRKRRAGTALFDRHGACRARGIATWIEVPPRA
jgi:hypothetical protein